MTVEEDSQNDNCAAVQSGAGGKWAPGGIYPRKK